MVTNNGFPYWKRHGSTGMNDSNIGQNIIGIAIYIWQCGL